MLRHDIGEKKKVGTVSEAYPHLVLDNFTSKLGQRVASILRYLFPCPKARPPRVHRECCPGLERERVAGRRGSPSVRSACVLLAAERHPLWAARERPGRARQEESKRVVTLANQADFISFRHHTYEQPRGAASVALTECGPRFELKLYRARALAAAMLCGCACALGVWACMRSACACSRSVRIDRRLRVGRDVCPA